ncbi:MAG: peroxidase family protein [Gammaproteobacteria bacterium]|nr:peroxidase family protein [Gammaproteobacteria bacterium]
MKNYLPTITLRWISVPGMLLPLLLGYSLVTKAENDTQACIDTAKSGLLRIADDRSKRFMGKVQEDTARCRGGEKAAKYLNTPWVDWQNYYAAGDASSKHGGREAITKLGEHLSPNGRGVDGALLDLEYQRMELIKFNLFDQNTYEQYITGRDGQPGPTLKYWDEMRLPAKHKHYQDVGGDGKQLCKGDLITHRTLTGICNDLRNPLMGSSGMPFGRNMQFDATFPRLGLNELTQNRHGKRIGLLKPDPQLISRKLFTREQTEGNGCNQGLGGKNYSVDADCDYIKAPFFNVLAAFWIQFMTHDWFSHTFEGRNTPELDTVGCLSEEARALGCREDDRREPSLYKDTAAAGTFKHAGQSYNKRAPKTTGNLITAWWDASQIYGHDELSLKRVQRDPDDPAKLLLKNNYLPLLPSCESYSEDCPVQPQWLGQEAAGFPANWNIGTSFYHNLFTREHNYFVTKFRELQKQTPDADSGMRNPDSPDKVITLKDVSDERLFQAARLVVAAEIAKIHTIEWTTQLLYDEPLFAGMNSNWYGLFNHEEDRVSKILRRIFDKDENLFSKASAKVAGDIADSGNAKKANSIYSVLASGAGIFGLGNKKPEGILWWKHDAWDMRNLEEDVNGGINHFGSPFNFPEEFTSVYRLHALAPDLIEFRESQNPNKITLKIPVVNTARGGATELMHQRGIENWALSMGRQRLGLLHLRNQPLFLQNLPMPHLNSKSKKLDIVALDLIRDRERGVPRFNEFRRQIGLKTLTSFDDFVDQHLDKDDPWRKHQEETVTRMREIYGTHTCNASKIISKVQRNADGNFINDCLGYPDGSQVDNIEDIDNIVGWLAEYTRPHGFAISETQFHIFIINASRRLFSDRFFTSSFRPEFYSSLGYDWVMNDGLLSDCPYPVSTGADDKKSCLEPEKINGHTMYVSPLKRIMLRNIPELKDELLQVKNVFDPWARDRGEYYSLAWKPRPGAESDPAFTKK